MNGYLIKYLARNGDFEEWAESLVHAESPDVALEEVLGNILHHEDLPIYFVTPVSDKYWNVSFEEEGNNAVESDNAVWEGEGWTEGRLFCNFFILDITHLLCPHCNGTGRIPDASV